MNSIKTKEKLVLILKGHYSFEDFEFEDFFLKRKVKELDFDSIAILEVFLVVEEGFGLDEKISSKIEIGTAMELSAAEFINLVSDTVEEMLNPS
jgi:hypothetical protein